MGVLGTALGAATTSAGAVTPKGDATKLNRLTIRIQTKPGQAHNNWKEVTAQFNPNSLAQNHELEWDAGALTSEKKHFSQFTAFKPATLSFDLFFDTTEVREDDGKLCDVRTKTADFLALTMMLAPTHEPPCCLIQWGEGSPRGELLLAVATGIKQTLNYFDTDGTALRATLNCAFREWIEPPPKDGAGTSPPKQKQSNDLNKAYVIRRGDTLPSIAHDQMHDSSSWRRIAQANNITDPLSLQPGHLLQIPTDGKW